MDERERGPGALMAEIERRCTSSPITLNDGNIAGYAALFGRRSRNLGSFVETIERTAFNKSRGDGWPEAICRYNDDDNMLLGTAAAGTLRLSVDDSGLSYLIDPPRSRSDVVELVQRGDVSRSSVSYRVLVDDWALTDRGYPVRHLMELRLVDVGLVSVAPETDTSAALRSLAHRMDASDVDVRDLAEAGELRRLFARSDRDATGHTGVMDNAGH